MNQSLFDLEQYTPVPNKSENKLDAPLAARMRPTSLDHIIGQDHLLSLHAPLRVMIDHGILHSIILWGPPGSGKTTIAELIAQTSDSYFTRVSGVTGNVAELRNVFVTAQKLKRSSNQRTILFIDEIHRFTKSQQDALLPYMEDGTITLIGATTENPSFEINNALLSRSKVFVLQEISTDDLILILNDALQDTRRGLGADTITIANPDIAQIARFANGDARIALGLLELVVETKKAENHNESVIRIESKDIEQAAQRKILMYDKDGENHYNYISVLHKCLRGSDPDAGLYWLGRMLESGEDPLYIIRRLLRFASEDVGMADPNALSVCVAVQQTISFVGMPEATLALAQAVVYLALAPKSNALYMGFSKVQQDVFETRNDPVPLALRNAPTKLLKELDYGKSYKYAHDYYKNIVSDDPLRPPFQRLEEYLPENLKEKTYYHPTKQGNERGIFDWLFKRRSKK